MLPHKVVMELKGGKVLMGRTFNLLGLFLNLRQIDIDIDIKC